MAATATTLKTGLEITAARRAVIKGFPHRWQSRPAATQTAVRSYSSACRTNPDVSRIARWNDLQPDVSQVCAGHGSLEAASHEPEHVESRNMRRGSVYATGCLMHRQRSRELPLMAAIRAWTVADQLADSPGAPRSRQLSASQSGQGGHSIHAVAYYI